MWNRQKEAAEAREHLERVEGDPESLRGASPTRVKFAAGGAAE
jgi:hypothetical protein